MNIQNTIFKYPLGIIDIQIVQMPKNAKILCVQVQNNYVQLWALVNEAEPELQNREIAIYGTGNPVPSDAGEYISTFQYANGSLVFHVFELKT